MSCETNTTHLHPMPISLQVILARDPPSSDHDTAQAYIALTDYLHSIRRTTNTDSAPAHLRTHIPELAKSIEHDILYAINSVNWIEREGIYDVEPEEPDEHARTYGGALRCYKALQAFDMLCRFYAELWTQYSFIHLFKDTIAIVGSPALYFQEDIIRSQAAYTLRTRLCCVPESVLDYLYDSYITVMHAMLGNEDYIQKDAIVLHYCILSVANLIRAYPSTALPHLALLLPELYPILTTCHPTLRARATQAIAGLAHAYAFHSTAITTTSDFEHALAIPLRDWAKAEAGLRKDTAGDTFWKRLRESKHGGGTWAWRVCSALLVLMGRRVWWYPKTLRMLTYPIREHQSQPSSSESDASGENCSTLSTAPAPMTEETEEDGPTRAELTADIYRLLAHAFASMRLWQQAHGYPVSAAMEKGAPLAEVALGIVTQNWPAPSTASTPEPHQQTHSTQPSMHDAYIAATTFVPAILCALGPNADDEDKAWNIKTAIGFLRRMLQDGSKEGEDMLARLVGVVKGDGRDAEIGCADEGEDREMRRRETVLARLRSRRTLGQPKAPILPPVDAQDVKALEAGDVASHWGSLVECWMVLVESFPYSDNVVGIFRAFLASSASLSQKVQLVSRLAKIISLPPDGDASAYDIQTRFWDVALSRLGAEVLQPVAQPLLRLLLASPPSETDDPSSCFAWICFASKLLIDASSEEWGVIDEVIRQLGVGNTATAQATPITAALARAAPLCSGAATHSLKFISQFLKTIYDDHPRVPVPSSVPIDGFPAITILSALRTNITSHGISVRSAIALVPGLSAWIGDERRDIPDKVYHDEVVKVFEVLLGAMEPSAPEGGQALRQINTPALMTLQDLSALAPLFECAMKRLSAPGHAADALWSFWTRVHARLGLKGDGYPLQIQIAVSALCVFLGHEVPEGMETQEDTGASQMVGQGIPSIQMLQPPVRVQAQRVGSPTQGQTSSAMYWAAQSSLPSRLMMTQPSTSVAVPPPAVLPSPSQLAVLAGRVQASLFVRRDEPAPPPAKRRRLTQREDEAKSHLDSLPRHQPSTSRTSPQPQEQPPSHAHSNPHHPHTASSTRSRKLHLPTPAPSEVPLSSPIDGTEELIDEYHDEDEVVPESDVDEDWDGDEGMIVDEDEDGEEEDGEEDCMKDATGSIQCARGHEDDVPGVVYGGGNASRSMFSGRYTYCRREKEEEEIVPATPGADDDHSSYSSPASFFSSTRKRLTTATSPLLTFNLPYSQAGSPSTRPLPALRPHSEDSPVVVTFPSALFSYSARGTIEILRNLPRGQRSARAGPGSLVVPIDWDPASEEIPSFGGDDIPGYGADAGEGGASLEHAEIDPNASGKFSYSEQGSPEILRNLPRGPVVPKLGGSASHAHASQVGKLPGLGGNDVPGLGLDNAASAAVSPDVPSYDSLVNAVNTVETFVARGVRDERASAELARLRGILARI